MGSLPPTPFVLHSSAMLKKQGEFLKAAIAFQMHVRIPSTPRDLFKTKAGYLYTNQSIILSTEYAVGT